MNISTMRGERESLLLVPVRRARGRSATRGFPLTPGDSISDVSFSVLAEHLGETVRLPQLKP